MDDVYPCSMCQNIFTTKIGLGNTHDIGSSRKEPLMWYLLKCFWEEGAFDETHSGHAQHFWEAI